MIWPFFALAASLLFTVYGEANRHFRLPGDVLNAWRGAVPVLVLLPGLPFLPLPQAWQFYALTALNGLVISFADARLFDAAARFGGAQILRLQPLVLVLVFVLWTPLDPAYARKLLGNPPLAAATAAALGAASVSLFLMIRTPITREALRYYLPAILAGALIDPINKLTTRYADGLTGALCYAVFTSFFVFLFLLPRMGWRRREAGRGVLAMLASELAQPAFIRAGLLIGALSIAFNIAKNMAMAATPNPAFVTAVIFCSGLWATLHARFRGEPDDFSLPSGLAFIASAIALALLGVRG